jgi:protein-L-isoaspartate(D-aspartate) O-methyltransferase
MIAPPFRAGSAVYRNFESRRDGRDFPRSSEKVHNVQAALSGRTILKFWDAMFGNFFNHGNGAESPAQKRARMVEEQLRARGIRDERVLAAMARVPREAFIASEDAANAYGDFPLPIGAGQTISQPYIVAAMVEALELHPEDRVLEVGTGTGYEAAILGELAAKVWTIERHAELAGKARETLQRLGYANVHVVHGDGSLGLPEHAPFNKILVAAAAPRVPEALLSQLADGGRLAVPVGTRWEQQVEVIRKLGDQISVTEHDLCRFVPLVGEQGWEP